MTLPLLRRLIREVIAGDMSGGARGSATAKAPGNLRYGQPIIRKGDSLKSDEEEEQSEFDQNQDQKPKAACVLIVRGDGKVLAVSRKDNPSDFGLPGGKVDEGEEPINAAVRELQEETGLVASDLSPVFCNDDDGYVTTTFRGTVNGEIDTPESGLVRWVDREELFNGSFGEYNKALFAKVFGDV